MSIDIFSNIVFPLLSGFLLLLCAIYFFVANSASGVFSRHIAWFLLSFAFFIITRPLQLFSGEYPLPLIVSNIRFFLLCALTMPALVIGAELNDSRFIKIENRQIIAIGIFLGLVFVFFHTLGASGSYLAFQIGDIAARRLNVPIFTPPWYGREVSIVVQILLGAIIFLGAAFKLLMLLPDKKYCHESGGKWKLLFYSGILFFGIMLAVGSAVKTWAWFYIGSFVSALMIIIAVFVDIDNNRRNISNAIPLVRDALLQSISFGNISSDNISNALRLLGKNGSINSFAIIGMDKTAGNPEKFNEKLVELCNKNFHPENHLPIPLTANISVIAFASGEADRGKLMLLFEQIAAALSAEMNSKITIGISQGKNELPSGDCFHEALLAHEFSERQEMPLVVHADSLNSPDHLVSYPYRESHDMLLCVRLGDRINAAEKAMRYFDGLKSFSKGNPEAIRHGLYVSSGGVIDFVSSLSANADQKLGFIHHSHHLLDATVDLASMRHWLVTFMTEAASFVAECQNCISHQMVSKAREFIDGNFQRSLTLEEVAQSVSLSPSYFTHLFKNETGLSFSRYLTEKRMAHARELLLGSSRSITDIAYSVGYNDSNYFSTAFRNMTGVSPSEYRKQNRSSEKPAASQ